MAYNMPLMLAMMFCPIVGAYSIVVDKTKRTFESLLATPLSLRQLVRERRSGPAAGY